MGPKAVNKGGESVAGVGMGPGVGGGGCPLADFPQLVHGLRETAFGSLLNQFFCLFAFQTKTYHWVFNFLSHNPA